VIASSIQTLILINQQINNNNNNNNRFTALCPGLPGSERLPAKVMHCRVSGKRNKRRQPKNGL